MPGKRPRQIQRTTSMSQLGLGGLGFAMGAKFSQTAPEGFYGDAGALHRGLSSPPKQEIHETMEVCTGAGERATPGAFMEENPNNMAIDGSAEESAYVSHAVPAGAVHQATGPGPQYVVHLGALPPSHQATHLSSLSHPLQNKSAGCQSSLYRVHDAAGSAQPSHFLDVCFLCSKRLGHGRDVFIYRGDRAFCSVECRHFQIVADERREKCGLTAVKEGVGVNTAASDPPSTGQVETAAAA